MSEINPQDNPLYEKEIKCPVCKHQFKIIKVKSKACKVLGKDSDFCINYEKTNPLFYETWVCPNCCYAALFDTFFDIPDIKIHMLNNNFKPIWSSYNIESETPLIKARNKFIENNAFFINNLYMPSWTNLDFSNERTIDTALESFKLAYYIANFTKSMHLELAKISIRIAWMYRFKKTRQELLFLNLTLQHYMEAYEKETVKDETIHIYMIGELNLRIGNYPEALKWFGRLITLPKAKENKLLIESARDQMDLTKSKIKDQEIELTNWQPI